MAHFSKRRKYASGTFYGSSRSVLPARSLSAQPTRSLPATLVPAVVKIENLSKSSQEEDLRERLLQYAPRIQSIRVLDCPDTVNYAYVNCSDTNTATSIVNQVHKKILLNSHLLTAKLKGQRESTKSAQGTASSVLNQKKAVSEVVPRSSRDERCISVVKLLIHDGGHLTGTHLDRYFAQYGQIVFPCVIHKGNPDYCYVNFNDAISAENTRRASPHHILGATVMAVPGKPNSSRSQYPTTNPPVEAAPEIVNLHYPCDPLALKHVEQDAVLHRRQIHSPRVTMTTQKGEICVCAEREVADQFGAFIRSRIKSHEAEIDVHEAMLGCYYLPILVDQAIQRKISEIQVPFETRVKKSYGYSSLEELAQVYSKADEKTVESSELKQYLLPKSDQVACYQWFWLDGFEFKPYTEAVNKKLEQAFVLGLPVVVSIDQFDYKIDTSNKTQTNTRTKKVREMKRKVVHEADEFQVCLQIRAHSDHLSEVKREIMEQTEKIIKQKEFKIPHFDQQSPPVDHFLQIARRGFVDAESSVDADIIVLRGEHNAIKNADLCLREESLKMQNEAARFKPSYDGLSTPDSWEPQESKCELKSVSRGSTEWRKVEHHMMKTGSSTKIFRIERIQNLWLWEDFYRSRKRMSDKNNGVVNEKLLFHGTRGTPPKKIYNSEQGFDNRLASTGLWGEGIYFAVDASYSDKFAHPVWEGLRQMKQMFLACVITGITYKCSQDRSLKLPPKKADCPTHGHTASTFEDERYDSVSGYTNGTDVFVVYKPEKVYPAYLITYEH